MLHTRLRERVRDHHLFPEKTFNNRIQDVADLAPILNAFYSVYRKVEAVTSGDMRAKGSWDLNRCQSRCLDCRRKQNAENILTFISEYL